MSFIKLNFDSTKVPGGGEGFNCVIKLTRTPNTPIDKKYGMVITSIEEPIDIHAENKPVIAYGLIFEDPKNIGSKQISLYYNFETKINKEYLITLLHGYDHPRESHTKSHKVTDPR